MPYKDPNRQREYLRSPKVLARNRRWKKNNPEKVQQQYKEWYMENGEEKRAAHRDWNKANHEKVWAWHIKRTFGLTPENYMQIFNAQGGKDAITKQMLPTPENPRGMFKHASVDHSHVSKRVRGLLLPGTIHGSNYILGRLEGLAKYVGLSSLELITNIHSYLSSEGQWPWIVPDKKKKKRRRKKP